MILLLGALLGACADEATDERPTSCQQDSRAGTYLIHAEKISGTCPEMGDSVVNLSAPPSGAGTCTSELETWSENNCKLERVFTCVSGDLTGRYTIVTRQERSDGSVLAGTYGVEITDANGPGCIGSYRLTYTRQ